MFVTAVVMVGQAIQLYIASRGLSKSAKNVRTYQSVDALFELCMYFSHRIVRAVGIRKYLLNIRTLICLAPSSHESRHRRAPICIPGTACRRQSASLA